MRWKNIQEWYEGVDGKTLHDWILLQVNFYFIWCCEGGMKESAKKRNQFGGKVYFFIIDFHESQSIKEFYGSINLWIRFSFSVINNLLSFD